MPYDQFVKLQIAGDLIGSKSKESYNHLVALGLFGLGAPYYKNSDAAKAAADELDDRVDTLTRGFLGLTVSCGPRKCETVVSLGVGCRQRHVCGELAGQFPRSLDGGHHSIDHGRAETRSLQTAQGCDRCPAWTCHLLSQDGRM